MKKMTLQEIQNLSLNILKNVHEFCVNHNIRYSLAYGTLIGAIRHKGFIPWDDDIDIIMPRPDYEKFCKLYKSEKYDLLCDENDSGGYMMAFARVCDCKYTFADTVVPCSVNEMGVWIDVFPADNVSDDFEEFKSFYHKSELLWKKSCTARHGFTSFPCRNRSVVYNIKLLAKKILFANGKAAFRYIKEVKKRAFTYSYGSTGHWSQLCCLDDGVRSYHSMDCLSGFELAPFEDAEFYIMKGYDEFLRNVYGDYMQLPPEDKRVPKLEFTTFYWKA